MAEQDEEKQRELGHRAGYIQIKKFTFVMFIFLLVFGTAGVTLVALSFGDEKAANVAIQERGDFGKLYHAYDLVKNSYFADIDHDKVLDGAIDGMIKALDDPYSDYMTKEEAEQFSEQISSSFQGIGAEIQELEGNIVVVSPIKGSPAEKAGMKPRDKIIQVDDENIQGMTANEAVMLIRGEKGTKVNLVVDRDGTRIPFTIIRDEIPINTVYAEMLDDHIAKIQITSFSTHTYDDLKTAIADMEKAGMKGLILDVRQNPGGLLEIAEDILNLFISKDEAIYQIEYKDGTILTEPAKGGEKIRIPMTVLIDGGSASASEILAGALSESANVKLVGEKSFGKGTVQTQSEFNDGSNLKYTMAKWLTPKGNWIHEKGIEPNVKVPLPTYSEIQYIDPENKLEEGLRSEEVKSAKEILKLLGYEIEEINNEFDEQLVKHITEFQKKHKLKETGIITGETTITLFNEFRDYVIANDPQVEKAVEVLKEELK